jgi:hypothetical protein
MMPTRLSGLLVLLCLPWCLAAAEPAQLQAALDDAPRAVAPEAAESPADVQAWIQRETTASMLHGAAEGGRQLALLQSWQPRAPTWIQSAATVNLGDFPTLDDPTATAERDLQTMQWVLEEQRRLAAGKPSQLTDGEPATLQDNWLRKLLPRHWIATLKANREWVAAGGTALLVIVWATAAFSRRPGAPPSIQPETRPAPLRHRRRHRDHGPHGTRPAALTEAPRSRS